ncbi:MAG TPA: response regulator, partial [Rhodocyclaceae bacterium]|nr:response regulator [Rhodocyclaceae bacterium]
SKYKSEFLANMSHELRTPLNSLLILSDQLCKNAEGNLTPKQVEFSKTIHASGNDLLALINDILDLSKIESGTVAVDISELRPDDLNRYVERSFRHFADGKNVDFHVRLEPGLPKVVLTDIKRLQQIIKNLLSNAFKFTHAGEVSFSVATAKLGWSPENEELNRATQVIAYAVSDTGIGISPDKQQIIFEAFQQADGSTSRKYGGTGLGLAISRELAKLLGGEIKLVSSPGHGSTFTLYLPQNYTSPRLNRSRWVNTPAEAKTGSEKADEHLSNATANIVDAVAKDDDFIHEFVNEADDDRNRIASNDKVLLIIENDLGFAKVLLDAARQQGFKGVVSTSGAAGLAMTREYQPKVITLDIFLPDMQGWRILDRLKADLSTRHIPICVVSTDDSRERALNSGAIGFITKPLKSRDVVDQAIVQLNDFSSVQKRKLLVLASDEAMSNELQAQLPADEVEVMAAANGNLASEMLRSQQIDCLVIDERISGFGPEDLLDALDEHAMARQLPVVLYGTDGGASSHAWKRSDCAFAVREAHSFERLIDQTSFFLHRDTASMSANERRAIESLHSSHHILAGRKALIVDDDMRNIFALATVLDEQGMQIVSANNGREAIRLVQNDDSIDIVLMDIMMPEMDGIATMEEIRKLPCGQDLPIIAVTAKAMKGDREKCIEAGAWDYLSKPVDTVHLLAVLRGWLYR